jgi:hypothetical protein
MPILGILASSRLVSSNSYESISTVTVGSGGQATITFSSIPSTYKHLQVRMIAKTDRALNRDSVLVTFNSDTTAKYTRHGIYGDGSSVATESTSAFTTSMVTYRASGNTSASNIFGAIILDFLDYSNTTTNKTMRTLGGVDLNGAGEINFYSGMYASTAAINSISFVPGVGTNFLQYSQFALYGIKG